MSARAAADVKTVFPPLRPNVLVDLASAPSAPLIGGISSIAATTAYLRRSGGARPLAATAVLTPAGIYSIDSGHRGIAVTILSTISPFISSVPTSGRKRRSATSSIIIAASRRFALQRLEGRYFFIALSDRIDRPDHRKVGR